LRGGEPGVEYHARDGRNVRGGVKQGGGEGKEKDKVEEGRGGVEKKEGEGSWGVILSACHRKGNGRGGG